jgi:Mn-dependent DtxR family transcriptional regulator
MRWARRHVALLPRDTQGRNVLVAIANACDRHRGATWASQKRLAADWDVPWSTWKRLAADLERRGLIYRQRRHRVDGTYTTDLLSPVGYPGLTQAHRSRERAAYWSAAGGRPRRVLRRGLHQLDRTSVLDRRDGRLALTETGAAAAHAILERRVQWSSWLEYGSLLTLPDAREPDPRDLRASLGDECVDRLEALAAGRTP